MRFLGIRRLSIGAALWAAVWAATIATAAPPSTSAVAATAGPSAAGYVDRYDCSRGRFLDLRPGQFVVAVEYEMQVTAAGREKVGTALCRAAVGAWVYRYKRGNDADWVHRGLQAKVVGYVDGNAYQAAWDRDKGRMFVAVNLADRASIEELVFTFGHELGHAVLRHPSRPKDTSARTALSGAGAGAATGYQIGKRLPGGTEAQVAGTLIGILAGGLSADSHAHKVRCNQTPQLKQNEIDADEFGVRVLYHQGYTLVQAKLAAMTLLSTNWQEADCTDDHPATSQRVRLVEKLEPLSDDD